MNRYQLEQRLRNWREEGRISALDRRLGLFVAEGSGQPALGLLAAVTSRQLSLGHVCLDPSQPPEDLPGLKLDSLWPALDQAPVPWLGRGAEDEDGAEGALADCPLVLEHGRLYLGRLHAAESGLARFVRERIHSPLLPPPSKELVQRLFPGPDTTDATAGTAVPGRDGQRRAAVLAALRPFAIITGGPGTGKTTTVVRVLAMRLAQTPGLAIRLLAPTGKAAARLSESLVASRGLLPVPEALKTAIPTRVSTVHRFLGLRPDGRARYHRHAPAPVDLVVLDEASMIDLPTMYRLVQALSPTTSLILLGDPHQLASVDAGSVLADLVEPARADAFTAPVRERLIQCGIAPPPQTADATALDDSLARLSYSYRFSGERGIGRLADAVRAGDIDWDGLRQLAAQHAEIEVLNWRGDSLPRAAWEDLLPCLDPLRHQDVKTALAALSEARILCARRRGPDGVESLNALVRRQLQHEARDDAHGQPLLVTRNAPALGVYNGDMGILWREADPANRPRVRACFADGGRIHRLPRAELPDAEPAWALTVHKSQGSEYERILLVLPPEPHPLVTRELIYTALTRARRFVRIVSSPATWNEGIAHRTRRASGLARRLPGCGRMCTSR